MLTYAVLDGAAEVPVRESHKRGKNWTAVVKPCRTAPDGLERRFVKTYREHRYFTVAGLSVGDVLEFGADYYSGAGRKQPHRRYAAVLRNDASGLMLDDLHETEPRARRAADAALAAASTAKATEDAAVAVLLSDVARATALTAEERALADGLAALAPDRRRLVVAAGGVV
jgi:hypothetical protein